jgi:hypothetical protein
MLLLYRIKKNFLFVVLSFAVLSLFFRRFFRFVVRTGELNLIEINMHVWLQILCVEFHQKSLIKSIMKRVARTREARPQLLLEIVE